MSEFKFIKRDDNFWWSKPYKDDETVFLSPNNLVDYSNFGFSFLYIDIAHGNRLCLRYIPNLCISRDEKDILFDGGIVIDYKVVSKNLNDLKSEIMAYALMAHDEFIEVFTEREQVNYLFRFKPVFNKELFKEKLSLLPSSFFPMLF